MYSRSAPANLTAGTQRGFYLFIVGYGANGDLLGYIVVRTFPALTVADGWVTQEWEFTPDYIRDSGGSFNGAGGAKADMTEWAAAPSFNRSGDDGTQQFAWIEIEDVTSEVAAESSASVATSEAAVATAAAAAAQHSMSVAASIGQGFLNSNSGFDDYPSDDVGSLPEG